MNQRGGRNVEARPVSMKSGLGDRNNKARATTYITPVGLVSMKSGLGDRNNGRLHEWPPQHQQVSMKSGLGDRNNPCRTRWVTPLPTSQ